MLNILVSVIIPVYNVEKYIHEAMDSIIKQTHRNLEIILVDDGSTDNCGKICDDYAVADTRVKVIHKLNGGVSSARNEGIKIASGKWTYFMDPDDWIEPDTVEKALKAALQNGCDMCMFDYDEIYRNKKISKTALKYPGNVFKDLNNNDLFMEYMRAMGVVWNLIIRTYVIKQLKFNEHFLIREDELFKLQLYSKIKSFCYIEEILYHYRQRQDSAIGSGELIPNIDAREKVYEAETKIVNSDRFPENAVKVVHSKYLNSFFGICSCIFAQDKSNKEKKYFYKKYINSKAFRESIQDYSALYLSRINVVCLKKGRAPRWLFMRFMFAIRDIRKIFKKRAEILEKF